MPRPMCYRLQKLIHAIIRDPAVRQAFFEDPEKLIAQYELSPEEKSALLRRDYARLYRLGVHGLILRPFSLLHKVPDTEYLRAIREG